MSKKKSQPVVMPKKESNTMVIKIDRVAIGHQSHITGTGAHDPRPKRKRTRASQLRAAMKEYNR
tara:strand:+ start:1655 stop:1846 length:192 start_codon:yes stop_codon:yes gene_type:complete